MNELAQARIELTLLEEKARELLKRLLEVRATIATQRSKINELSRTSLRPSTINRLPTEILVLILDLDVHTHHDPGRKQNLASVCQRWRDVILQTPCFWSTIYVASDASSIMTHLEKSRGTLLDIVIEGGLFSLPRHLALLPGLDIVTGCPHRWRSLLVITTGSSPDDDSEDYGEKLLAEFIADRINRLHFPSLKSIAIFSLCDVGYLDFLSIARAPALEHLELDEFMTIRDILNPVAILKTLRLNFRGGDFIDYPSCWSLVPTQALTKLSLSGEKELLSLQPNSLHFPSLMSLEMVDVAKTRPFLDAIVVPNLKRYTSSRCGDLPSVAFSGFSSKFTNVRQLSFSRSNKMDAPELLDGDAISLCEAFPGAHHVELDGGDWPYLFDPPSIRSESGPNSHIRYPMDLWTGLESLTFNRLHSRWLEPDLLTAWLVHRRVLSLQQLHVKVKGPHQSNVVQGIDQHSIRVYERLEENCILELDGFPFPMMDFPSPGDSSSGGHSLGLIRLLDEIAATFLPGGICHSWA